MTQLRQANRHDLDFILTLEEQHYRAGFVGTDPRQAHLDQMSSPDCAYWIIEHDATPAGYAILCGVQDINRSILRRRIAVSQPSTGIGRQALHQLMSIVFHQWRSHRLWLDVYFDNHRARSVYRQLGFVEEGTMRECIWHNGEYRSLVLMSILETEYRS